MVKNRGGFFHEIQDEFIDEEHLYGIRDSSRNN